MLYEELRPSGMFRYTLVQFSGSKPAGKSGSEMMNDAENSIFVHNARRTLLGFVLAAFAVAVGATAAYALDPHTHPAEFGAKVFRRHEGLPLSSVTAVASDSDGFVWIGTQEGLARYDGVRFEVFDSRSETALVDDFVTADVVGLLSTHLPVLGCRTHGE